LTNEKRSVSLIIVNDSLPERATNREESDMRRRVWRSKRMRHAKATLGLVALVMFVLTSASFAAVIQNIGGNLLTTDLYHGNGDYFQTNYAGTDWPAYIDGLYFSTQDSFYWMDAMLGGGTFALGPSALVSDLTPSGGLAKGLFASGATLTISGDLYADDWATIVATGDLVTAVITTQWELKELAPPARADTMDGRAFFHVTGGALSNASLNDAGLVLGDFYLDFSFQACSPTVTDFSTLLGNNTYNCVHPSIQGTSTIPEPASIVILGLGGAVLFRRRK
jgi:hypothetical protein